MNRETLGERLRTTREALPASVYEAARDTKIRADFLQAMERDSFRFVSEAYARGMLRSYSRWLGLDPDEITTEFDRIHSGPEVPVTKIFKQPAQKAPKSNRSRWAVAAAIAALTLMALSVAGLVNPEEKQVASVPAPPQQPPQQITSAPTTATVAEAPIPQVVRLSTLVTGERCWMRVVVDGDDVHPAFEGTLTSGVTRTFEAKDSLQIVFGNLGAVSLNLNGRNLGVPGRVGETGTLVFTANSFSRLPG